MWAQLNDVAFYSMWKKIFFLMWKKIFDMEDKEGRHQELNTNIGCCSHRDREYILGRAVLNQVYSLNGLWEPQDTVQTCIPLSDRPSHGIRACWGSWICKYCMYLENMLDKRIAKTNRFWLETHQHAILYVWTGSLLLSDRSLRLSTQSAEMKK